MLPGQQQGIGLEMEQLGLEPAPTGMLASLVECQPAAGAPLLQS